MAKNRARYNGGLEACWLPSPVVTYPSCMFWLRMICRSCNFFNQSLRSLLNHHHCMRDSSAHGLFHGGKEGVHSISPAFSFVGHQQLSYLHGSQRPPRASSCGTRLRNAGGAGRWHQAHSSQVG